MDQLETQMLGLRKAPEQTTTPQADKEIAGRYDHITEVLACAVICFTNILV
jgi:hypothetical protein